MSSGVISHGAKLSSRSAIGNRITSLLKIDPRAIFQTIGSSRAAGRFCTYFGVTAVSSITTPSDFAPAFAVSSITDPATFAPTFVACAAISST